MKQIKQNGVDSFDPSRLTMWSDTNIFCHNKPLIKAYIELAEKVHEIAKRYNVPLIIDDRVDVALAIDAEGVHV